MRRTADEEALVSQAVQRIQELIAMELADLPNDIQSIVLKRLPDDLALKPQWRGPVRAKKDHATVLKEKFDIDLDMYEDQLGGGYADKKLPSDFDLDELVLGVEIEMEHTDDPYIALEISCDHLEENDHYYSEVLIPAEKKSEED